MLRKVLPTLVAATLLSVGCVPANVAKKVESLTPSAIAVTRISNRFATSSTKRALVSLSNVSASLRSLTGSAGKAPAGTRSTGLALAQAAGYKIAAVDATATDSTSADDEMVPDVAESQLKWYYDDTAPASSSTNASESVYTSYEIVVGKIASGSTEVPVERYLYTMTYRAPNSQPAGQETGSYTREEDVQLSESRKLGKYVTSGTYTTFANGRQDVDATQTFTPKGGGASTSTTLTTSISPDGKTTTSSIKGANPGGGTMDVTYTAVDNTIYPTNSASGSASASVPVSGTYTLTQNGTMTNAKGDTFLLDTAAVTSFINGVATEKSTLNITLKDSVVLHLDATWDGATYAASGALYMTDAAKTKVADIAVNTATWDGILTYADGATDKLPLEPVFDVLNNATNASY